MWRESIDRGSWKRHHHHHRDKESHYGKKSTKDKVLKPLWKDLKNKNVDGIEHSLQQDGINLIEQDPDGTLLMFAVKYHYVHIVKVLLDHKSPVCCDKDEEGQSPLHHAIKYGYVDIIELFIQHNITLDEVSMYDKRTALHIAVKQKHLNIVKLLLKHGADPNIRDIYGMTPIHIAAYLGYDDILKVLLQHGADGNLCDNAGWGPLLHAAANNKAHSIRILMKNKVNISAQSNYGKTALHLACEKGFFKAVQELLDHDALTDIKDVRGKMPHEYAQNREVITLMKLAIKPLDEPSEYKRHIQMQLKSKSLIDLLDPEYIKEDFYEQHRNSDTDITENFHQREEHKKYSFGRLATSLLNNIHKKRKKLIGDQSHTTIAECHSIPEMQDLRQDQESTPLGVEAIPEDVETISTHSEVIIELKSSITNTSISDMADKENESINLAADETSLSSFEHSSQQSSEFESSKLRKSSYIKFTSHHLENCQTSITHVSKVINDLVVKNQGSDEKSKQLESLQQYLEKWFEETQEFKTTLSKVT